jgi:hypothetical protein
MLFTTKELAAYFSQDEQWVYNKVSQLNIKPVKRIDSENGLSKVNFYNIEQRIAIEIYLKKAAKNVIVIENNYYIYPSKLNDKSIEELEADELHRTN